MKQGEVFYYADEFNVSWLPTLRKMWSPRGQQVMIPTPGQPKVHYGLGAVNYHTGETLVIIRRRKRRQEVAELLQMLVDKHPNGTGSALPAYLQPMAQSHRDALASFPQRSHSL